MGGGIEAEATRVALNESVEATKALGLMQEFLERNNMAVLSGVLPEGQSASSLIEIVPLDNLRFGFSTMANTHYRKFDYMRRNPQVSAVVGFNPAENKTLQYQGLARHLTDGSSIDQLRSLLNHSFPDSAQFNNSTDARFFVAEPTWARYSDFSGSTPVIRTLHFQTQNRL
jgi:hypothetical protein